jgi:hypothetical protein
LRFLSVSYEILSPIFERCVVLDCHFERERETSKAIYCSWSLDGSFSRHASGIPYFIRNDIWAELGFIMEHAFNVALSR